jgi:hypothetical protein
VEKAEAVLLIETAGEKDEAAMKVFQGIFPPPVVASTKIEVK